MVTVQIASDLHIEYKNNNIPNPLDFITPSADILILLSFYAHFQSQVLKTQVGHPVSLSAVSDY